MFPADKMITIEPIRLCGLPARRPDVPLGIRAVVANNRDYPMQE
jgi:hypothetical protein